MTPEPDKSRREQDPDRRNPRKDAGASERADSNAAEQPQRPAIAHLEWLKPADYDMETAEYMLAGGRNVYAVFMCHLSVEKALKGLYQYRLSTAPPKTHSLMFLLNRVALEVPPDARRFLVRLGEAYIATRYPDELSNLQKVFDRETAAQLLRRAGEVLSWIKKQF